MTLPKDAELVGQTLNGDNEAYKELVARYQGHVYGLAYSLVGNWTDAQDIAQETFIRAYANIDQLKNHARFAGWLRRVAFSVAMNWLKAFRPKLFEQLDGRIDLDHLDIPDFRPGPAEVVEKRDLAEAVLKAVESLPQKYRVPLTMFHLDGLSYRKVADFLDIPLGTAKSLIYRAKEKLKPALSAYANEEITPAVQEVFNEHKLPKEFAEKIIEGVPVLAWGKGKECTFAGSLEAATAATDHPYKYSDIMGWTGMAFRVRWFCGNERTRWCGSCAVGEMEEEIAHAARAMGWELRIELHRDEPDMSLFSPEIVASIDAGKPIPAYADNLNMAVIYGYRDEGKTLLFRDYFKAETPLTLPAAKLGWLWLFLGEFTGGLTRREALVQALKIASHNWHRGMGAEGPGKYWYGKTALTRWLDDIAQADELSDDERTQLFSTSGWNFVALIDARKTAMAFLRDNSDLLEDPARQALVQALRIYKQEVDFIESDEFSQNDCFLGPVSGKGIENWSKDVRARERRLLSEVVNFESAAIAHIEKAVERITSV